MFAKRIERLTPSLVREILAVVNQPDMISFAGGLPAEDALYRADPALITAKELTCWQYGQTEGERELRELIVEHAHKNLGINCDISQVLVLSGSQQGIDLVGKLFIDEGTPVLAEAPTYLAALQVFSLFGADMKSFDINAKTGPDLAGFSAGLKQSKLTYLIPTFQNPSGYCYPDQVRADIAAELDKAGVPLFEDDPYRDLSFDGPAPKPVVSHLKSAPWIYQGSFSKTLAPGLRLGYMIAHPDLIVPLTRLKQAADLHSNRLSQQLIAQILRNGVEEHIQHVLPIYRERRDAMAQALTTHLADKIEWELPAGGLFFWVKLKKNIDTKELMRQALKEGVAIMPGVAFFSHPSANSYLRLNFSHASPEKIDTGIARLSKLL